MASSAATRVFQSRVELWSVAGHDLRGEEGGVAGPGRSNGKGRHWNSAGHLHGREKSIHTVENPSWKWHPEHGPHGMGRNHTSQMSCHAGGANEDPAAGRLCRPNEFNGALGGSMGRGHVDLEADAEDA
jgi:hypothetical protein